MPTIERFPLYIGFTEPEVEFIKEAGRAIHQCAGVADGDPFGTGLTLVEADEERAGWEAELAELLINAAARAGVEV